MTKEDIGRTYMNVVTGKICDWDEGLLTCIHAPGNGVALVLEEGHPYIRYCAHNIFSQSHSTVFLTILTQYFFDMELFIDSIIRKSQ